MIKKLSPLFLGSVLLLMSSYAVADEVTFARVDPFEKIFRETTAFKDINDTVEVASGESATFQFAIRCEARIKNLRIGLADLTNEKGKKLTDIETGFVGYTHVGVSASGRAKDVVIPPSRYYPDPIFPNPSCDVGRDMAQPMWITVNIPNKTRAGVYTGTVNVSGEADGKPFTFSRKVSIHVYPVNMEEPTLQTMHCYYSFPSTVKYFDNRSDGKLYSEAYWRYLDAVVHKMKELRQNVAFVQMWVHLKFGEKEGKYTFDFSYFDRVVETFLKAGINKHICGGGIGGHEGNKSCLGVPEFDKNGNQYVKYYEVNAPQVQNFYKQFLPAFMKHLKAKKWDKIYTQHVVDEPSESNADDYMGIIRFIKSVTPDLMITEACSITREGAMDVWVPVLDFYHDHYKFFCDQQKQGKEVWFYTCCGPQGEYANHYIELPAIKVRLLHWIHYKYGATGYQHWAFDYWVGDLYKESAVFQDDGQVLPAGDCWIVYPSGDGRIFSSIRFEAMRDGVADHTLLTMLGRKNPALAKELCSDVIYDWTKYNTSSSDFKNIRHRILTALSK